MQQQRSVHKGEYNKLLEEVKRLRKEKEEEQNLLAQSLVLSEEARIDARLKHEITRLTRENLVGRSGRLLPFITTAALFTHRTGSSSVCLDLLAGDLGAARGTRRSYPQAEAAAGGLREKGRGV